MDEQEKSKCPKGEVESRFLLRWEPRHDFVRVWMVPSMSKLMMWERGETCRSTVSVGWIPVSFCGAKSRGSGDKGQGGKSSIKHQAVCESLPQIKAHAFTCRNGKCIT